MNPLLLTALVMAAVEILTGALFLAMPRLTRPELWFAVTVSAGFGDSEPGRRILRSFRTAVLASTALALLALAGGLVAQSLPLVSGSILLQLAGYAAALLRAHRQTLPHATPGSTVREAELVPRRESLPGGIPLQAGPFAILAAAAALVGSQWERLPARYPTHWDLTGTPNAWATRTPLGVFATCLIGTVLCGFLVLLGHALLTRTRRVSVSGAAGDAERDFRQRTLAVLLGAEYLVAINFAVLTALPLFQRPTAATAGITALALAFVAATIAVMARAGQGGSRLAPATGADRPVGDRTADEHWRLGFFYVNRTDPALLVEKRFGVGYTFNFGRPASWLILVAILAIPLALTRLLSR